MEYWIYRSWTIGSTGTGYWIYRRWNIGYTGVGYYTGVLGNQSGIVELPMDVSGIGIPVQSPRRVKEQRETKMNESRIGYTMTTMQEVDTRAGSNATSLMTPQSSEQTDMTEMETDHEAAPQSPD